MQLEVLLALFGGTVFGFVVGVMPGLTGNMAIALSVPFTFAMSPIAGLAFLSAIYYSAMYGGAVTSILLGIPGTISNFPTILDGYPIRANASNVRYDFH